MTRRAALAAGLALAALALAIPVLADQAPPGASETSGGIRETLRREQERAEQGRAFVLRLTRQERELFSDLARVEDELDALHQAMAAKEADLAAMDAELAQAQAQYAVLSERRDQAQADLRVLVAGLWPLHLQRRAGVDRAAPDWESDDRRFTWTEAVYADTRALLGRVRERSLDMEANMARQQALRAEAEKRLDAVNQAKDEMLAKRLAFVARIREVRAERMSREQALAQVLAAIEDLDYRLKQTTGRRFVDAKGSLPWPVAGQLLEGKAGADGLNLAVAESAPVRAVFWGKVVHDDVLRGFGRVVIVSHGDGWYSLYAYLARSSTAVGREVEKGEALGLAGYCPTASGPGLYFELRQGQKPIIPQGWFATPEPIAAGG